MRTLINLQNDDGFTLVEVLAAIALISFLGLMIYSAVPGSIRAIEKTGTRSSLNLEIISFDTFIRETGFRVMVPYWETDSPVKSEEDDRINFLWIDGCRQRTISLCQEESGLKAVLSEKKPDSEEPPQELISFSNIKSISSEPLLLENVLSGYSVTVEWSGEITTEHQIKFGNSPLTELPGEEG